MFLWSRTCFLRLAVCHEINTAACVVQMTQITKIIVAWYDIEQRAANIVEKYQENIDSCYLQPTANDWRTYCNTMCVFVCFFNSLSVRPKCHRLNSRMASLIMNKHWIKRRLDDFSASTTNSHNSSVIKYSKIKYLLIFPALRQVIHA